jgi:glycosyltransferase involved in cell wall biosynthesis
LLQHGETSLLFPAGDVAALTASLAQILDDANLRDMGQRAQNWTRQKYMWKHTTAAYDDIYARALKVPSQTKEILKPEERFFSAS